MHLKETPMKRTFERDHGHDPAIYKFNHQSHCSRPSLEPITTPNIGWEMIERRKMIRSTKALS